MTNVPDAAFGTAITYAGNPIGELTSIGGIEVTQDALEVTSHSSANQYREFIGGLLDGGDVPIEGNFYPGDTLGQIALKTAQDNGTLGAFVITLPAAFATTWTFNALVTKTKMGDSPVDGIVPFSASLKISGKPVLGITASVNITALTITDSVGAATPMPAFAAGVYEYVVTTAAACTTYNYDCTFAAGICTIVDGNGGTQTVLTTVDSSEIAITDAGMHTDTITVKEATKAPTTYTFYVMNA